MQYPQQFSVLDKFRQDFFGDMIKVPQQQQQQQQQSHS